MEQTRKQKKNKKHLPLSSLSSSHYALIMSNTCNCFYCHFYFVFFYRWSPSFFFFFGFCCRESLNFITEFVPSCGVLVFFFGKCWPLLLIRFFDWILALFFCFRFLLLQFCGLLLVCNEAGTFCWNSLKKIILSSAPLWWWRAGRLFFF